MEGDQDKSIHPAMHTAMHTVAELLPLSAPIDRGSPTLDGRMEWKAVPAKGAVYLLMGCDEAEAASPDKPLLLATVGDLRAALKRRLDDAPPAAAEADAPPESAASAAPTRRIPYHRLCTRVAFQIVHSPFVANWIYLQAARALHPDSYHELLSFQPAWWVTVNLRDAFPRLRPVQSIAHGGGARYAGPIRDRAAAGGLIDAIEDLFDLCREYPTLQLAPHGRACAYKEMGKCPAPCDGSVDMAWYHRQMEAAWAFITDPAARDAWIAQQQAAMREAAGRLEFERAARIKSRMGRGGFLAGRGAEAYAYLAPLEEFSFLSIQPGRGKRVAEVYLVHGGSVSRLSEVQKKDVEATARALAARVADLTAEPIHAPFDQMQIDIAALLAHHLFRRDPGVYLRTADVARDPASLHAALDGFFAAPAPEAAAENASETRPETAPETAPATAGEGAP